MVSDHAKEGVINQHRVTLFAINATRNLIDLKEGL